MQCLILENKIITNDDQRKIIGYIFRLKSFEHNDVILFQVFLEKSEKLISWVPNKSVGGEEGRNFFRKKIDRGTFIRD